VLVHSVLGIARADGITEELVERVLEPLRTTPKKTRRRRT
jgi:hypothetical protein